MNFVYTRSCNLEKGKTYWGIVKESEHLPFGVYAMQLDEVDYTNEVVLFEYCDRASVYFSTIFSRVSIYVYESQKEAEEAIKNMKESEGLYISDLS